MRVVLIKSFSLYGGTRLFIDQAAMAFQRRGWDVEVVDLTLEEEIYPMLHRAARAPTDLVFSINCLGEHRDPAGRAVGEILRAPHVIWHVDYILAQEERVLATPRSTAMLMVDPTQVGALEDILGADRFACLGFLPHPAVGEAAPDDTDAEAFVANRPIPLLWSGSHQRSRQRPWADSPEAARQIFDDATDLALSVEWMPPHEALDTAFRTRGLDLSDLKYVTWRMAAKMVHAEIRFSRRFAFLEALAVTGLPLHICGAGWADELHRFPNAVYEGEVEMTRMTELMRRSRVVLNTNANFGAGSHERPFSAFLAGAAVFSDYSRYYAEAFAGDEIAMFHWQALDAGMQTLQALVDSPQDAFQRARRGKARVLAGHTWDHGVDVILEAARAIEAQGLVARPPVARIFPPAVNPPG
ncbi:MAG: glycosyltransferase [Caulobacteraceae bacterium]